MPKVTRTALSNKMSVGNKEIGYIRRKSRTRKVMQLAYFYEPGLSDKDPFYTLREETSRHCVQVLRMQAGSRLLLTNGKGLLAQCTIVDAHRKQTQVQVENSTQEPPPARNISIAIGLLKNSNRFEWFLEKATELGIAAIVPLLTEHTEKQKYRMDRMTSILEAAIVQSRQTYLPQLSEPQPYADFIRTTTARQKFIAHCEEDRQKKPLGKFTIGDDVQILIGPEGDFSPVEIQSALYQEFVPVSLGDTRLRTETAGVAAAALLALL